MLTVRYWRARIHVTKFRVSSVGSVISGYALLKRIVKEFQQVFCWRGCMRREAIEAKEFPLSLAFTVRPLLRPTATKRLAL
jgi:hypothetical protein